MQRGRCQRCMQKKPRFMIFNNFVWTQSIKEIDYSKKKVAQILYPISSFFFFFLKKNQPKRKRTDVYTAGLSVGRCFLSVYLPLYLPTSEESARSCSAHWHVHCLPCSKESFEKPQLVCVYSMQTPMMQTDVTTSECPMTFIPQWHLRSAIIIVPFKRKIPIRGD